MRGLAFFVTLCFPKHISGGASAVPVAAKLEIPLERLQVRLKLDHEGKVVCAVLGWWWCVGCISHAFPIAT